MRTYVFESVGVLIAAHPLWIRGLSFMRLFANLDWGAAFPLLRFAIAGTWIALPILHKNVHTKLDTVLAGSILIMLSGLLIHRSYLYFQLLATLNFKAPWGDAFFASLTMQNVLLFIVCISLSLFLLWRNREIAGKSIRAIAVIYIMMIAVAMTGEYGRHAVFAVPIFMALLLITLRRKEMVFLLAIFLSLSSFFVNDQASPGVWFAQKTEMQQQGDDRKMVAYTLDAMMDSCGYDRFLPWGGYVSGYMKHSPYHMPYQEQRAFDGANSNTYFQKKYYDDLGKTPVVVGVEHPMVLVASGGILLSKHDSAVKKIIEQDFTVTPPDCARKFIPLPNEQFSLYFRR
jgi:hypothetical protein